MAQSEKTVQGPACLNLGDGDKEKISAAPFLAAFLALHLIVLPAGALFGEDPAAGEDILFLNLKTVTASSKMESVSESPADVLVITEKEIRERGYRDLKDVFNDLPGVDVSYDVQGEVRTLPVIHGISENNKILVLLNGQKLNSPTGERFVFGNNIPLDHIKRIEVLYGPSSSIYGADAYAGVINLITKEAREINGAEVKAGYGSNSTHFQAVSFGKRLNEEVSLTLAARNYTSDGQPYDRYFDVLRNAVAKYPANAKYAAPIRDKNLFSELKVRNLTLGLNYSDELESNPPSTIPTNYLYVADNLWGQQVTNLYGTYNYRKGNYELIFKAAYYQYKLNDDSNFWIAQSVDASGSILSSKPEYKYALSDSKKGEAQLNLDLTEDNAVVFGVSAEDVMGFSKTQNLKNGKFDTSNLVDDTHAFQLAENGVRPYQNYGQFLQLTNKTLPHFTFSLGERVDYNTLYRETFNPRAGATWTPNDSSVVKLIYGTAYIQPSLYYKYENWANSFAMHIPNPDLKPEKLSNLTFLVEQKIVGRLSAAVSLFRNEIRDLIKPVPIDPLSTTAVNPYLIVPVAQSYVEINKNQGEQYTQGIDLRFKTNYPKWNSFLYYSYIEGRDTTENFNINKISSHKVNLGVTYKLFEETTFTPLLRWVSDIQGGPGNSDYPGRKFPGYTVVNLNCSTRVARGLYLNLNVINLLNETYYSFSPYAESVWILPRAPQPLRTILATLEYRFN